MTDKWIVNSYDEWSQLRDVIVGRIDGFFGFHFDNSFDIGCFDNLKPFLESHRYFKDKMGKFNWPLIRIKPEIIAELNEDIEGFVKTLKSLGVIVHRPSQIVGKERIQTPFWTSYQSAPLNVRDQTIILGSTIVETAPTVRSRIFENDYMKPLFYQYMLQGAHWQCMPRPTLCAGALDPSFFVLSKKEGEALKDHHALPLTGLGLELVFDGAQCIRVGKDVLVNVANRNHELGLRWLISEFGDIFNFHRLDRLVDNHIDSLILPLRPGLWLLRSRKVLEFIPPEFRKWDVIVAPGRTKYPFPSYKHNDFAMSSRFLDMNLLSINEKTVIVNSLFPELIEVLEDNGFKVIPVLHRHGRLFGGGFHCFTLDMHRDGNLKSYV